MRKTSMNKTKGKKSRPKTKLRIPDLEHSKASALRSLGYIGCKQRLRIAVNDRLGIEPR
jgi:hypothetical protein